MAPNNRKTYNRVIETYFTIRDPNIADIVAKHVTSDLPDNSVIFESCPGSGVLTKKLLKSGVQSVRVFESNPSFLKDLEVSQLWISCSVHKL